MKPAHTHRLLVKHPAWKRGISRYANGRSSLQPFTLLLWICRFSDGEAQ